MQENDKHYKWDIIHVTPITHLVKQRFFLRAASSVIILCFVDCIFPFKRFNFFFGTSSCQPSGCRRLQRGASQFLSGNFCDPRGREVFTEYAPVEIVEVDVAIHFCEDFGGATVILDYDLGWDTSQTNLTFKVFFRSLPN